MTLTPAQQATVKANILASTDLNSQPTGNEGSFQIAALYELPASPDYWVFKTSLGLHELTELTGPDGTVWAWTATGFIGRSPGELACFDKLFNTQLKCNPSFANVRQAFLDIFSGSGNAAANRTHIAGMSRRKANRLEKLLVTTGNGASATPSTLGFEGTVSFAEIEAIRNLP